MKTEGINWILAPTRNFPEMVAFFRDVMGMPVTEEGVPVTDTQFSRYALLKMPTGAALELVEPKENVAHLYNAPVVSLTVDDVVQARQQLESTQVDFVTPIFDTKKGWGWTYFRAPDGTLFQLQGPYKQ